MTGAADPPEAYDRVGLVVVSHSRPLADAAVALAAEMVTGYPSRTAVAAGLDATTFGTDAVAIKEAIESVDGPAGVVVLMDLGSAVLSAELALELLDDPAAAARVTLCPAPLVEGLVAATVTAAGGATRAEVAAEATAGLLGKQSQLSAADGAPAGPAGAGAEPAGGPTGRTGGGDDAALIGTFVVDLPHGLHARPAARLVGALRGLRAEARLTNRTAGGGSVDASSLSRVTALGVLHGHEVAVRATGPDAQAALDAVLGLAARHFGEEPGPAAAVRSGLARVDGRSSLILPAAASPGIGMGPAWHFASAPVLAPTDGTAVDPAEERGRLAAAVARVAVEIDSLRDLTAQEVGGEEAAIFAAHLLLLEDPDLIGPAEQAVDAGSSAATAWAAAVEAAAGRQEALSDPYLRARAADLRAVGDQVLSELVGARPALVVGTGVLITPDLTPAQAALLTRDRVSGIVIAFGSATGHGAILARARGIPAVVGAGADVLPVADGTFVVVDGDAGDVLVDPGADAVSGYRRRADEAARRDERQRRAAGAPAATTDGRPVTVAANLGSVDDARAARACGADEAGLVRTEFLFLDRDEAPGVDEQVALYRALAEALDGRRITLRTLDVGGDKPLRYLPSPREANPFLGLRGLRFALRHPVLLRDQLRAVVAVARETPVSVMFPMVSTAGELRAARDVLDDVAGAGGLPAGLRVGMMVEVPAAALKATTFLRYLDFLSIGTNDLTQYALAAERGNPDLQALADPLDPGVLRLVDHVCRAAASAAVPVAVCGEAAADPAAVPVLVGLGVGELSVSPYAVPGVKELVRAGSAERWADLAAQALDLAGAEAVRTHLGAAET